MLVAARVAVPALARLAERQAIVSTPTRTEVRGIHPGSPFTGATAIEVQPESQVATAGKESLVKRGPPARVG